MHLSITCDSQDLTFPFTVDRAIAAGGLLCLRVGTSSLRAIEKVQVVIASTDFDGIWSDERPLRDCYDYVRKNDGRAPGSARCGSTS